MRPSASGHRVGLKSREQKEAAWLVRGRGATSKCSSDTLCPPRPAPRFLGQCEFYHTGLPFLERKWKERGTDGAKGRRSQRGTRREEDPRPALPRASRMPVRGTRAGTPSSPAPAPPKMTAPPGPGLAAAPHPRAQSGVHANPGGPCAAVPLASGPRLGSPRKPEERLAGRAPSRPGPCAPPGEGADCKALRVLSEVIKKQQPPHLPEPSSRQEAGWGEGSRNVLNDPRFQPDP